MTEALRERFGKYHVLEKIAQGGMAEVYKVKTIGIAGFEKIQALKRILPSSAREGRFIRSFIDEARIAVELTHRNIVQVFDFGKADGELFLAMELIEGKDLRTAIGQALSRDLPCPIPVAAYIIGEAAAGLDYAHRKTDGYGGTLGIVHCDVSPSNVMLSTDGYVKILDFGIARASFASALERRRLRGKPRYMAPEQTVGEPPTPAADVFALGIIAWELFTGMPLYRGADLKAILEAVRKTNPPRIDRINPAVPEELVDAVAVALTREPTLRGTSADLVAAFARTAMRGGARALAKWLADIEARPSGPPSAWEPGVTSISVPASLSGRTPSPSEVPPLRPSTRSVTQSLADGSPLRPSARSITHSLANVPPDADFGTGTPGFADVMAPTEATRPSLTTFERPDFARSELRADAAPERFPRIPTEPLESTPVASWVRATTVSRLADVVPEPRTIDIELPERAALDASPVERRSYHTFTASPATIPFAPRFEDEVTHHGMTVDHEASPEGAGHHELGRGLGEATSYDELEVDGESMNSAIVAGDEPIDDDFSAVLTGALAERRRSVVVAALLEGAAPEVLHAVTKSLGELAYQRGGVVVAIEDRALVAAFGLEVAGEDDVAVAMGWALDASAIARDAGDHDLQVDGVTAPPLAPILLRIGARTGVATSSTSSAEAGVRIPPDAIEEARALAREAQPDRPLFLGTTGRLTSALYTLREVPTPRRIARRSKVIEVVGPRPFDERDRARLERRGKLFGRTPQITELETWLGRTIAANRRLSVLITGAAGTGKSRLVAELVARQTAAGRPLRVVATAASPANRFAPFALVIDLYQAALGLAPARGRHARAQVTQRLLQWMTQAGAPLERARAVATDLDRAMELRDGVGVSAPEVADLRPRVSAGLAAFRASMTSLDKPLLTIIEDIHHVDGASLEVLRHTLAVPANGPELLVLTARPEELVPPPVDVVLTVGDLVGSELRGFIADRLGDAATPFNIAAVLARGGGNPLFVEELAQAVREAGGDVPASARDVVAARLDRLGPKVRAALRFAAVLGGTVRARIIEELLGEDSLEDELDQLVEAGLLVRPASAAHSTEGELTFARGLVREVVYDSLSARAQRDSHARIGRLLASRFFAGRDEPPAVIAEHLERGGEPAGAAAFWLRAGRLALGASDADTAVAHFTRTLALERELGIVPATATSRTRRREALAGREEARRLVGDLVSDPGDLDELQRLCEGEPARLADVALRRAQRMLRIGDYANAHVATVVAEDHAGAVNDDRLRGEALRVRGEILERIGRFDEALDVVGTARELFHRRGAVHEEMAAMIGRGRIHLMRAHYEAARDAYTPVLALIDKTGDPWLERIAKNHVAVIDMCLGNFAHAMVAARRSLDLCRRYGDRAREGDALSVSGIILLEVGLHAEAAELFDDALEILTRTASRWSRADCLIYAGVCDVRRGVATGVARLDEALDEARKLGARYLEANALVARAGAQLRLGALDAAVADATLGAEVARRATLVGYEIQGLARHARALVRLGGRPNEASVLVHRALDLLAQQRYLEGSEEEILVACAEVLAATGSLDRAHELTARARANAERKLAGLTDPTWRAAYVALPEILAMGTLSSSAR